MKTIKHAVTAACLYFSSFLPGTILPAQEAAQPGQTTPSTETLHRSVEVDGLTIFYREAGPKDAPVILLLHGFPTSSHMFRNLIPALADRYHLVAPDYPGYGQSSAPPADQFEYSFDNLARVMERFTERGRSDLVRPLPAGLWGSGGIQACREAPGTCDGADRPERKRLRPGDRQRLLETDQGLLGRADSRRTVTPCVACSR